jgi:hypothetical protein
MIRLLPLALIVAVLWVALRDVINAATRRRSTRAAPNPKGYAWEPKTEQLYRRIKNVSVPGEDRERILAFVESRRGVEAYMEPRTLMYPLSVVLVAEDGEWMRFQLRDDSFIRDLTRTRGLRVFDAGKVGYPDRMRRHRNGGQDAGPQNPKPS